MRFRFDGCELDTHAFTLLVGGREAKIEPQVFDVLRYLVEHRDRTVTKNELLDNVWGDRFVSETALTSRIKSARRAIGDDGRAQRMIRTVHGRGYQFVAAVEIVGDDGPAVRAPAGHAVPLPPGGLVGRARELAELALLLADTRLLTLTGPGGVGKTRLATELAVRVTGRYADGVCFAALADTREAESVPERVLAALGVHAGGWEPALVAQESLRGRSTLLVVDNVEHVIDAAPFVGELLARTTGLTVVATSRERLRLAGERVYEVLPLAVEDGDASAVALFEQAARAVDPGFAVDDTNREDVEAICRAVDGLPLAVELAAARVRVLQPKHLRARLDTVESLGGRRDQPARHQTVRAAIEWSYELLSVRERRLFDRLGVFAGAASLDAVEAVCGHDLGDGVVGALAGLVDKSLVRSVPGRDGEPRFRMLELIRAFAADRLAASPDAAGVRRRHVDYIAAFLADVEARRWGAGEGDWLDAINERIDDVREARRTAVETGARQEAARIVGALYGYWQREGRLAEGAAWTEEALSWAAELDPLTVGWLHLGAGYIAFYQREMEAATKAWGTALETFRALGHDRYVALSLVNVAGSYIGDGSRYEEALRLCDEGIAIARRTGEALLIAHSLNVRGEVTRVHGDDAAAEAAYTEALGAARASGDRRQESVVVANLAYIADHRGDHGASLRLGREALAMCWSLGQRLLAAWSVSELAGAELGLGRPDRAARLVGAADEAFRIIGAARGPGDQPEHDRVMHDLEVALGVDRLGALVAEGAAMTLNDAVAYALTEPANGFDVG